MKWSDHFGTQDEVLHEITCLCAVCVKNKNEAQASEIVESGDPLDSGFAAPGFGRFGQEFEEVQSLIEDPCQQGGIFSFIFGGLFSLLTPVLAPLGKLASDALCSLFSSEAGRKKLAADMAQALKQSKNADLQSFFAINFGNRETVSHWYNQFAQTEKLFSNDHVIYAPKTFNNYVAVGSLVEAYREINGFPTIGQAYPPATQTAAWDRLIEDPSYQDSLIDLFTEVFVIYLAAQPQSDNLYPAFDFAYAYTQSKISADRAGYGDDWILKGTERQTVIDALDYRSLHEIGNVFRLSTDDLNQVLTKKLSKEKDVFSRLLQEGSQYLPQIPSQKLQNTGFKKIIGIDFLFDLVKRAYESQALKAAKERNPNEYQQIVSQSPDLAAYLAAQRKHNPALYGSETSTPWLWAAGLGLLALAVAVKRKDKGKTK